MKVLLILAMAPLFFISTSSAQVDDIRKDIANSYYELSVKLATARDLGLVCDVDAYMTTILDHLSTAISRNPDYIVRASGEKVFRKTLNSNLFYRELVGELNPYAQWAGIETVLSQSIFYAPARGVYGNTLRIEFEPNGKTTIYKLELLDEEPWSKWNKSAGQWILRVNNNEAFLTLRTDSEVRTYMIRKTYEWGTGYMLVPDGSEDLHPPAESLINSPSECEA